MSVPKAFRTARARAANRLLLTSGRFWRTRSSVRLGHAIQRSGKLRIRSGLSFNSRCFLVGVRSLTTILFSLPTFAAPPVGSFFALRRGRPLGQRPIFPSDGCIHMCVCLRFRIRSPALRRPPAAAPLFLPIGRGHRPCIFDAVRRVGVSLSGLPGRLRDTCGVRSTRRSLAVGPVALSTLCS